jgi:hypothetical protein
LIAAAINESTIGSVDEHTEQSGHPQTSFGRNLASRFLIHENQIRMD